VPLSESVWFTAATADPDPIGAGAIDPDPYEASCEILVDNVCLECASPIGL